MKSIFRWISTNRIEAIIFLVIILATAFLRFYKIDQYMTFLGDEGRDALVIKRTLVGLDPPLIGPPTSVGNMYLGPLYYYMMAVAMGIFWLNPLAAAGMVALIGTLSVALIYYLSRQWFGKISAIVASTLYSVSTVNIIYSRSSWNPNPAPFFSLLSVLGFYLSRKRKNYLWLILSGVALAFCVQMHYLALILVPILFIYWAYEVYLQIKQRQFKKHFIGGSIGAFISFLILMSPLAIFDIRHNFINFRAISTFFLGDRETTVNLNVFNSLGRIPSLFSDILVGHYLSGGQVWLVILVSTLIIIPIIWFLYNLIFKRKLLWPFFALSVWLIVGILGLSLYKQTVYDHYMGFLNPAPFLLIGSLAGMFRLTKTKKISWLPNVLLIVFTIIIVIANFQKSPLLTPPNNQLTKTQAVAHFVIAESGNKPFNFALISEHNYDAAYQFFLDSLVINQSKFPLILLINYL